MKEKLNKYFEKLKGDRKTQVITGGVILLVVAVTAISLNAFSKPNKNNSNVALNNNVNQKEIREKGEGDKSNKKPNLSNEKEKVDKKDEQDEKASVDKKDDKVTSNEKSKQDEKPSFSLFGNKKEKEVAKNNKEKDKSSLATNNTTNKNDKVNSNKGSGGSSPKPSTKPDYKPNTKPSKPADKPEISKPNKPVEKPSKPVEKPSKPVEKPTQPERPNKPAEKPKDKVEYKEEHNDETIYYDIEIKRDDSLFFFEDKVGTSVQEGQNGIIRTTKTHKYVNGVLVDTTVKKETIQQVKNNIVLVGTRADHYDNHGLEDQALNILNQRRQAAGLSKAVLDPSLKDEVQRRSKDISSDFSHDGASGNVMENIAYSNGTTYLSAAGVMKGWENSPGHNATLMRDTGSSNYQVAFSWYIKDGKVFAVFLGR